VKLRETDPARYAAIVASLMPKTLEIAMQHQHAPHDRIIEVGYPRSRQRRKSWRFTGQVREAGEQIRGIMPVSVDFGTPNCILF
jgi:hypothetical protein